MLNVRFAEILDNLKQKGKIRREREKKEIERESEREKGKRLK